MSGFAADGRKLIVSTKDGLTRVLDAADGRVRRTYAGHLRWVNGVVSLAPAWDVTASTDETIRLWTAGSARPHRVLHGHRAAISGVAALPGGGLISADADGMLRWLDAGVADLSRTVWRGTEGETGIYGIAFTPDGRRAVTAAWGGAVTLRDAGTGRTLWTKSAQVIRQRRRVQPGRHALREAAAATAACAVFGVETAPRGRPGAAPPPGGQRGVELGRPADRVAVCAVHADGVGRHDWRGGADDPGRERHDDRGGLRPEGRVVAAVASSGGVTLARPVPVSRSR